MHKFLPLLVGSLALTLTGRAQSAAPCGLKGIVTDPAAPAVNPEYAPRTNTFNWYNGQQYSGRWWNLNSQAQPNASAIWLPWEQSDNANMTHILGKRDLPADGWELIKRNLGYDDGGTPVSNLVNPYVVLYNKYSGMLRIFVAVGARVQDYQFAEIKLLFNSNGAQKKAGTLNRLEGIGTALGDTPPGTGSEFAAVARFLNQDTKWFMADFPMEYDPCACQFDSKLKIEVNLISQADIQLKGVTTGTLMSTNTATGSGSTGSDFDKAIAMVKKVNGVIKAGQSTYKTLGSYSSSVLGKLTAQGAKSTTQDADAKKAAFSQLLSALGSSGFLKTGLQAAPYIGAAVSILDSFIGGGKDNGPQPVSLQPMSIEMTTQLTGTMSATALYETITFNNPGTRGITIAEEYPYYNEPLGVLSVLERPVLERKIIRYTNEVGNRVQYQYRLPMPLQYLINPAAGLDVQDFQIALLQEGKNYPDILPGANTAWHYEGVTATGAHVMRTEYTDAACFGNNVLELDMNSDRFQPEGSQEFVVREGLHQVYLKLMLNLRPRSQSSTRQNVLLVLKYPVTVQDVGSFEILPPQPCGVLPQASLATVQTFCGSAVYSNAMSLRPGPGAPQAGPAAALPAGPVLYPSPASERVTVILPPALAGPARVYITDLLGRRLFTVPSPDADATQPRQFSVASLTSGMYLCVLEDATGHKRTSRFSVQH